jgi:hypothetical protein
VLIGRIGGEAGRQFDNPGVLDFGRKVQVIAAWGLMYSASLLQQPVEYVMGEIGVL